MSNAKPRGKGKNTSRDVLYAKALSLDFDPWLEMLRLAKESKDDAEKFFRLSEIMPYIKPKLRSMDVKVGPGAEIEGTTKELIDLFKEVIRAKASK